MTDKSKQQNDASSFASAMADVTPLRKKSTPPIKPRPRATSIKNKSIDTLHDDALEIMAHNEANDEYVKSGLSKKIITRLKRGDYYIDHEIDLHHLRRRDALQYLQKTFIKAITEKIQCLAIITGKGLHSDANLPIIKPMVTTYLRAQEQVLAFCPAPYNEGGRGVIYVLLKN